MEVVAEPAPQAAVASPWSPDDLLLVTGAAGLVGSHVVDWAIRQGVRVRVVVQNDSDYRLLQAWGAELIFASILHPINLKAALRSVTHIVHCAAKVGDWGPEDQFQDVNVKSLESFLEVAHEMRSVKRFVQISSLGVHAPQDHFGTDETAPIAANGFNAYARSKAAGEIALRNFVRREKFPSVVLRPGYLYGPRDRHVLPRLLQALDKGRLFYVGSGEQVMHNTAVGNLVDAIGLALFHPQAVGETFHITDGRLLTRIEFFARVAKYAGVAPPTRHVSWNFAWGVASALETIWRFWNIENPPPLTKGQVHFLGRNLEFSTRKARDLLGYVPRHDPADALRAAVTWFRAGQKKRTS